MPTRSIQETIADWEVLHSNLGLQVDQMPHVIPDREALQALIAEAKGLESQQEIQKSALRETNQKRIELVRQGRSLTGRIGATLRGHFGPESEQLIRYGFKPRAREIRRRFFTKAEKAARLAEAAASAAAEAAIETRRKEALAILNLKPRPPIA